MTATRTLPALALLWAASCGTAGGGGPDAALDAGADAGDTDLPCDELGECPLLSGVEFVRLGQPHPGYWVVTELTPFADRLYASASANPLGAFGAAVAATTDGLEFAPAITDPTSQGFLRMRALDGALYVPDGDPNGYAPSWVYVSTDGDDFQQTTVPGAVHTFDVAAFGDGPISANGMYSGDGSLCALASDGTTWEEVEATPYQRLRFLAVFHDRLFAAKRVVGAAADYLVWDCAPPECAGQAIDALAGEAHTWQWFSSALADRLYWSYGAEGEVGVAATADGEGWTDLEALRGEFVSDLVEWEGNLYALGHSGLWGSADGEAFELVAAAPADTTFGPVPVEGGYNAEATASLAAYAGALWCGSSTDGYLYRLE